MRSSLEVINRNISFLLKKSQASPFNTTEYIISKNFVDFDFRQC